MAGRTERAVRDLDLPDVNELYVISWRLEICPKFVNLLVISMQGVVTCKEHL